MSLRQWWYNELVPEARSDGISNTNIVIIGLVLASFLALALETEPNISDNWHRVINVFNIAILIIFAAEYALRLWVNGTDPRYQGIGGKGRYMLTPYALTDLLAFLPEALYLMFATTGANEDVVMVLRVLRLMRLFKIARFVPAFEVLGATMKRSGSQLLTSLAMALVLVFIAAVLLYFIEGVGEGREEFGSIPRALWWAIATLTTVGYGDVFPVTALGRIAASVIALAGIGIVALPAGVFASAFSDELRERELKKLQEQVEAAERAAVEIAEKRQV